ncbi:Hypothetical predicted protein [Octopus vulgaris]|uniref:Transmembrane protein n=1 Tax=Octopus vulgaris TaxID=6645 RepID=A0AA36B485_OCTVU|nr:Hypothetical predicted protein [Octopus vulgaris]
MRCSVVIEDHSSSSSSGKYTDAAADNGCLVIVFCGTFGGGCSGGGDHRFGGSIVVVVGQSNICRWAYDRRFGIAYGCDAVVFIVMFLGSTVVALIRRACCLASS